MRLWREILRRLRREPKVLYSIPLFVNTPWSGGWYVDWEPAPQGDKTVINGLPIEYVYKRQMGLL